MSKSKIMFFKPYGKEETDFFYNQLFGDDYTLFQPRDNQPAEGLWKTLLNARASSASLKKIAEDTKAPSIQRVIALGRLRRKGTTVKPAQTLAVIVESGEDDGMDTLAAYADGTVKFINAEGTVSHMDGTHPPILKKIAALMEMGQELSKRMEAWSGPRLAPPITQMVRLTFIATDGYFFGQGPIRMLAKDEAGGPIIKQASSVFSAIIERENKK
jgi:hypothetical protein